MVENKYDCLILGCGPAGQKAALAVSKMGKKAAIIEPRFLGGICTNTGTVPSKTFREAAIHLTNHRLRYMDRAFVQKPSMESLVNRVEWVINKETEVIERNLKSNRIDIISGYGRFVDTHTVEVTDKSGTVLGTYKAEKVIVCSGTQPFLPPDVPFDEQKIFYTDNVLKMKKLPRSLTIVGGGIIGMEFCSIFSILGVKVNLVEKCSEILSLIDRDIRANLISQLDGRKTVFHLNDTVMTCKVDEQGHVSMVLESGKVVRSESALYCNFRTVNSEALGLDKVGVKITPRGIIEVNGLYQTTNPDIFAAGDVVGHPQLASTSFEQGRIAGTNAFGGICMPMSTNFPIGIYTVPEISYAGPTEAELTEKKIPYGVGKAYYKDTARGNIMGALDGVVKILFHQDTKKVLAVHVIGENATELVHVGQAVLELGGTIDYFINNVFNYPTLAETYKYAALAGLNRLNDV